MATVYVLRLQLRTSVQIRLVQWNRKWKRKLQQIWGLDDSGRFWILLESRSRMPEYPMNLLPRYFESLPIFLGKMGLFPKVPYGINILAAIAFSVLSSCYFTDHKSVKAHLRWLLSCVIGESGDTQIEEVPIPAIKQSGKDGL